VDDIEPGGLDRAYAVIEVDEFDDAPFAVTICVGVAPSGAARQGQFVMLLFPALRNPACH